MVNNTFPKMPARVAHPERAVRVLAREAWQQFLDDWGKHLDGILANPPRLAPPSRRVVYFTDPESIFVCIQPEDFGRRLGIEPTNSGCGAVFFNTKGLSVSVPTPAPDTQQGLTTGGAREWTVIGNHPLAANPGELELFEVAAVGRRPHPLPLPLP